jgi:phosphate acetyltransferase
VFFSTFAGVWQSMGFIETVFEKVRRHPKRVVFPDGELPRVIRAAEIFYERQLGIPILLGRREVIENIAAHEKISLDHVAIVNPQTSDELPAFCRRLERLERYRKTGLRDSAETMVKPNYFAAMMVQYGLADALVGGVESAGGALLRPMLLLVKPLPFADVISSCTIVELKSRQHGDDGVLFFGDTGIVPDPTIEQLASIAVQTGQFARQVFGRRPRVAMLSFSTKGSARTASTEKVAAAVELARHIAVKAGAEMSVDGEMQADAALDAALAGIKMGESHVGGRANVLVFPDLNSGNISVKLVQMLADCESYGQMFLGFTKPAADLPRGCTPQGIVAMAALVGLQAIEYRKLYPAEDPGSDA